MTNTIRFMAVLMTIIFLSSFTNKNPNEFIGTYGVTESDPSQIKLTIRADNTFYYQDFSIPAKKIVIKGNWILKGKKVFLKDKSFYKNFHNVWTILENGKVAKSRNGLSFYKLHKIDGEASH
jgi:hypothetical protein